MGCQHRSFQKVWGLNSGANTSPKVTNPTDGTVGHVCSTWQGLNHIGVGNTMGVLLGQWRLIWFRVQKPGILPPERWSDKLWLPLHWFPFLMGKKTKKKETLKFRRAQKTQNLVMKWNPQEKRLKQLMCIGGTVSKKNNLHFRGSWTNHVMNLKWFPGRLAMGMNLLFFGMKMNMLMKTRKNPKNGVHDAGDEPPDPDAQLHQEIEQLSAPLKVRHVTLMEPIMLRGVQHVMPVMGGIMTRMKYMGIWVNRIPSDRAKELLASKFSVMGCQPKCSSILYCWGWPSKQRPL